MFNKSFFFLAFFFLIFCCSCNSLEKREIIIKKPLKSFTATEIVQPNTKFPLNIVLVSDFDYRVNSHIQMIFPCILLTSRYNPIPEIKDPLEIFKNLRQRVKYASDLKNGKPYDNWQTPFLTYNLQTGDCEDFAGLVVSVLLDNGYDAWVAIGSDEGELKTAHAWPVLLLNNKMYYIDLTSNFSFASNSIDDAESKFYTDWKICYLLNDKICYRNIDYLVDYP